MMKNSLYHFLRFTSGLLLAGCMFLTMPAAHAQKIQYPFQNPSLSFEERVNDLVSRLSLNEKVRLMQNNDGGGVARLGIPAYNWWNESLHGVARDGIATVFPQAIGMAATWNPALIQREADVISTEARAKHQEHVRKGEFGIYQGLTFWSPNINIFRDPRWGRGQETYGEDPFLTSRIGISFVKGLQGNDPKYFKVIATAKHFAVHSGPEPLRHSFDAVPSKRDLYETYLPAFEALVKDGHVYSVMGAYNRVYGKPACASDLLLKELLRDKWGFQGYVVSDCGAIYDFYHGHNVYPGPKEASATAVKAGTDLTCGNEYVALEQAVADGLISIKDIDVSIKRLFLARFKLGMFDPSSMVSYANIPFSENNTPDHDRIALDVAHQSMVLLKNNGILPLGNKYKKIAVVGPNSDDPDVLLGNYNGTPSNPVNVIQGIRNRAGQNTEILFEKGMASYNEKGAYEAVPMEYISPDPDMKVKGWKAEYFANAFVLGAPVSSKIETSTTPEWGEGAPAPGLPKDFFSIRYNGYLSVPVTGEYEFALTTDDKGRLYIDDKQLINNWDKARPNRMMKAKITLEKGKQYKIHVDFAELMQGAFMKLQWKNPFSSAAEAKKQAALAAAAKSDVVIFVGGISPRLEGEEMPVNMEGFKGGDRTSLDLPKEQEELLKAIKATGKPVVLVLMSGSALAVNWENENLPAILQAWYPGQEGGNAVADVLFGNYNPAGRLPVTFYKGVNDLPGFEDYVIIAEKLAAESAGRANANGGKIIVLPPVAYGVNTGQPDVLLDMNLNPSTQFAILKDLITVLNRQGIHKLVILNTHGGNDFKQMIRELNLLFPEMFLIQCNTFKITGIEDFVEESGEHAGELETSMMLYLTPELVLPLSEAGEGKAKVFTIGALKQGWAWAERKWTQVTTDTGIGNPYKATAQKGEQIFNHSVEKIAAFLLELQRTASAELYK